jgi:tetratricopeptide (TPR) repeat protein
MRPSMSRRRAMVWSLLPVLLTIGLSLTSCNEEDKGGGGPGGPQLTAEELNTMGWDDFAVGAYRTAAENFEAALALEGGFQEARLGVGWAYAFRGRYDDAISAFDVILGGSFATDAYAGQAAAALPTHPDLAIAAAHDALARNATYAFARRTSYDYQDLHLILAEANFALAQYPAAQTEVDNLNPQNGLDPQAPDYLPALSAEIERLSVLLASDLPD